MRNPSVSIDSMTVGTYRLSIIARMIVGAQKVQRRIEQTSLLQSKINRIGALRRAESARAQALVRFARIFIPVGQTCFQTPLAAPLKDPQDISRLRNFPARQRVEKR